MTINGGSDQVKSKIGGHLEVEIELRLFRYAKQSEAALLELLLFLLSQPVHHQLQIHQRQDHQLQ